MDDVFIDLGCWLEKMKLELMKDNNESICSAHVVAKIMIEKVALMLFQCADIEDRAGRHNKNTVAAFYSAGMLLDVCLVFGEMNKNLAQHHQYAKLRAAHLLDSLNKSEKPSDPNSPILDPEILNISENHQELKLLPLFSTFDKTVSNLQNFTSHLPAPVSPSADNTRIIAISANHSTLLQAEPLEQAQRFCENASKALERGDIAAARKNLTTALVLFRKQKMDERYISDSITPVEGAQKLCKYASCSLMTYKDFPAASKYFRNAVLVLNGIADQNSAKDLDAGKANDVLNAEGNSGNSSAKIEEPKPISSRQEKIQQSRPEDPNAWKPNHLLKPEEATTKDIVKVVLGILNKLNPSNLDKMLMRIKDINIDTEERFDCVAKLIFKKVANEPQYSSIYAKICQALFTKEVASSHSSVNNPNEKTNFRKVLMTKIQLEFEKIIAGRVDVNQKKKEMENCEDETRKNEMKGELEDLSTKCRSQSLGNMRFVGELFKLRAVSAKVIHESITRLLNQSDNEDSLECLCRLLTTIGKELMLCLEQPMPSDASNTSCSTKPKAEVIPQVDHAGAGGVDLSQETTPHHQTGHLSSSLPSGSMRVAQEIVMAAEQVAMASKTTNQQQCYSYPGAQYCASPGNIRPGSAPQFQLRAAKITPVGNFQHASPYSSYPLPHAPAVYYQQQTQFIRPARSTGSDGGRRKKLSYICIVDPNTNRDIVTGEEVPLVQQQHALPSQKLQPQQQTEPVQVVSTPTTALSDDGDEDQSDMNGGKSSSLRYAYKDDQWSPLNLSGKKVYDRNFLLELQTDPASMKKPDGLPSLEVVRDRVRVKLRDAFIKRTETGIDFTPPYLKMPKGKGLLKQNKLNSNKEKMDMYFSSLDRILKERKLSNRIRYIIMNLIDLRKNDWKSRREDIVIREEVDRDEQEKKLGCKPKHYYAPAKEQSKRGWEKKSEKLGAGNAYGGGGDMSNLKDSATDSKQWLHTSNVSTLIRQCLVLKNSIEERKAIGTVLKKMIRTKRFTANHILEGFQEVLQGAEQSFIDIPVLWEYLAQMIQPIFEEGIVDVRFLGTLAASLNPFMAPLFVAATLKELIRAQGGIAGVERLLILSNSSLSSILPGVDKNEFADQFKELEFLLKIDADRTKTPLPQVGHEEN